MMKDLIILVADKNTQFTIEGLLSRYHAFSIRPLSTENFDIYVHPLRDPGVFKEAAAFLRPFHTQYQYALVFLDREGSGQENQSAQAITGAIKNNLEANGWGKTGLR